MADAMNTCHGHVMQSGQMLGLCVRCAHLGPNARQSLAVPELVRGLRVSDAWECTAWAPLRFSAPDGISTIATKAMALPNTAQPFV